MATPDLYNLFVTSPLSLTFMVLILQGDSAAIARKAGHRIPLARSRTPRPTTAESLHRAGKQPTLLPI